MIGLKITKCDRAGLQITICFGLQTATKILKNCITKCIEITKCDKFGLQSRTDYKVIQYKSYIISLERVNGGVCF